MLSTRDRETLKFVGGYVDPGFTESQMARAIGCSVSTVKYWLAKGLEEAEAERHGFNHRRPVNRNRKVTA